MLNFIPTSITMISSLYSMIVMFLPISSTPPNGIIRILSPDGGITTDPSSSRLVKGLALCGSRFCLMPPEDRPLCRKSPCGRRCTVACRVGLAAGAVVAAGAVAFKSVDIFSCVFCVLSLFIMINYIFKCFYF